MGNISLFLNEINWVISILVAILLSISANLLTPIVQNWIATKSLGSAKKRLIVIKRELNAISDFFENSQNFSFFLIVSLLEVIVYFSIPNVIEGLASLLYAYPMFIEDQNNMGVMAAITGFISALFNLMAIVRAQKAIIIYRKVTQFQNYKEATESQIFKLIKMLNTE